MILNRDDLQVFERYRNAGSHAFSTGTVTEDDKDAYLRIFDALSSAAHIALEQNGLSSVCKTWSTRFYRNGGVQGQRPLDLWASVINQEPNSFGPFPQTYAIASEAGLELGFSVAIHEDDYYNNTVKLRNREIIPALYRKLPEPDSAVVHTLSSSLNDDGGWQFGIKSRQGPDGSFANLSELLRFLKATSPERGGGSIYKLVPLSAVGSAFNIEAEFSRTVKLFAPLMRTIVPTAAERSVIDNSEAVRKFAEQLSELPLPASSDGKQWLLRQIAIRQGQARFRDQLIDAYGGRCAITGTPIIATLQAAHIKPYDGPSTNSVSNGLLLRADIHNLFDLGLLQIDPQSLSVVASPDIRQSSFGKLHGRRIREPVNPKHRPCRTALAARWAEHNGTSLSA
ncbi:MAG: HNH endonuclease signature motif containing protein [Candidatus Kaistia colombiensis]|nr:MAG: HNH endonuclease signature motif containing protein [Kaistia sp.]